MRPKHHFLARSASAAALVAVGISVATAETRPSLNLYGATGLIDMPSGEAQPDGRLTVSTTHFGPVTRNTLSFQISPKLSGSFRFLGVRKWNAVVADQFKTYYDRSFDLRYQVFDESRYRPALTVGLQDFVGTGVLAGEYVAATKHLGPNVKVTAGLGWGRLGSYNSIGSPFGDRPKLVIGHGGNFNFGQWFRGPAAPFAGIEWQVNDQIAFKAEYSSDNYDTEAGLRKTFERKSPLNFGLEYQRNPGFRLGAYYMYGSEVGVAAHFILNPKARAGGGLTVSAPDAIEPRPSRAVDPEAWSTSWTSQDNVGPILRTNLAKRLKSDGVEVLSVVVSGQSVQVRIRNLNNDAEAQAVGRTARALTGVMPASVEQFEIVPMANGMPVSRVVLRRSDLEQLEFDTDATAKLQGRTSIVSAPTVANDGAADPDAYPRLSWSLGPFARLRLFDQNAPFKIGVGLKLNGKYELSPGLILSGSVTKLAASNLDDRPPLPRRVLQPVRSANYFYDKEGDPAIETLQVAYYHKLAPELYGRISAGYLERMFGGVSSEVLYMPTNRRWAIGAEVNYVAQRAPDQQFGFTLPASMYQTDFCGAGGQPACKTNSSYRVLTGHVSGYYAFDSGFHAQLDVGRYLAGDVGATFSLKREFENGWKIGAFLTKTDVSAADFGSGSFDKGITIEVPLAALTGKPSRKTNSTLLRPFGRDGGQRLEVEGRLYETVRDYRALGLNEQWGRFWK
jgi:hypothetical protein